MSTPLHALAEHGQSPWIDYLARDFVRDGELAALVDQGIAGVTSNPTIFEAAITAGNAYDDQLREVVQTEKDPKEVFLTLARDDIRDRYLGMRDGERTRFRTRRPSVAPPDLN